MDKLVDERIASYTPEKRDEITKHSSRKGWTIHQFVRLQIKAEKNHTNFMMGIVATVMEDMTISVQDLKKEYRELELKIAALEKKYDSASGGEYITAIMRMGRIGPMVRRM